MRRQRRFADRRKKSVARSSQLKTAAKTRVRFLKSDAGWNKDSNIGGSGCGSVGRVVASETRDPRFVSRHGKYFLYQLYNRKDENKEKEARNGPTFKKRVTNWTTLLYHLSE